MNFVFVSYNYDPQFKDPDAWFNKIEGYIGILSYLAKRHSVTRIKQIGEAYDREVNGVQFSFVNFGGDGLRFPRKLHKKVTSLAPDVVVIHGLHNPLQVIQLRLALSPKTRIIAQNHAEKPAVGVRKILQLIADRYIGAYLFASHAMGMDWVAKGNLATASKIHEVMEVSSPFYLVDKTAAKAKTGVNGEPVFLWVGRLDANKDPLNVVRAFLRFTDTFPEARLFMIYHTEELLGEIKAALANHPHGNAIVLVGKVPHNDLLYWYNTADFIISGSHYEGSGTAVCEAMSCGCVPIVTDIFSFRSMTDNGRFGLLYPPGGQQELLTALVKSQQLDQNAESEKVLAFFRSNLSFEAIAGRFETIAKSLYA